MKSPTPKIKKKSQSFISSVTDIFDWQRTLHEILEHCVKKLNAQSGSIFLMDEGNGCLRLVKAIGLRENRHCGKTIPLGEGISGRVAASKEPVLVRDFTGGNGLVQRKEKHQIETFISCPVVKDSNVLAVVNIAGRERGTAFSKADLKKLNMILADCSDALSQMIAYWRPFSANEYLLKETQEAKEQLGRIEKQLDDLRNYGSSILRCLSQYVIIFDRQFSITYSSKQRELAALFGMAPETDFSNTTILDLPLDLEKIRLKERLEELLSSGAPFSLNNVKVKDSSEGRVVNMFFSPFATPEEELIGGLLLVDDNTKNYEMQQRLVEAEKFSLIGSLTSMITHEVNNPLDGVMRLINLSLARLDHDTPVRTYLVEAQKGLQRIASLVSSLLSFSRKSISLNGEFAPLNTIVESAVAAIKAKIEDKDVTFALNLAPENPRVKTNDFYQVVNNLVSNSFDAIGQSGHLTVETLVDDAMLHIIVEDNGCGIPKRMQPHIFSAFWTTKEYGKGTGLGLAIVKKVVDKYEGAILVESEEKAGTKMHVKFPLGNVIFK
ncbi:MAG: hypothetical protein Kow0099_38530 [Candidatus Abyssubacteria bacterium]